MFDGSAFGREIVDVVKEYMERQLTPLAARLDAVGDEVSAAVARAVAALPAPVDGHSPGPEELVPLIDECVQRAVAAFPVPKDGQDERDVDLDVPDEVCELVARAVRTMAETPATLRPFDGLRAPDQQPINIYTDVRLPETKESIVNVTLPEQLPPVVNMAAPVVNGSPVHVQVDIPKRGREITTVTGHDKAGRITSFERQEVEDNG